MAIKKHSEVFLTYDPRKERWMFFLGKMFDLSLIIFGIFAKKSSFVRMANAFVERGFSVNMLTIDGNMQEKSSIVLQRLIYDLLKQEECPVNEFTISGDLRKSCLLASQRYKSDLQKFNSDKKNADISFKQRAKLQDIEVVKSKKAKLQESADVLRK